MPELPEVETTRRGIAPHVEGREIVEVIVRQPRLRVPVPEALEVYAAGAERIVAVSDDEVAAAIRAYFTDTHNIAEGAGAAPLAALMQERDRMAGRKVGVILCGGNIDSDWFAEILAGRTPRPAG